MKQFIKNFRQQYPALFVAIIVILVIAVVAFFYCNWAEVEHACKDFADGFMLRPEQPHN